jgi:pyridoxal phosphate enzyme (YggS family)
MAVTKTHPAETVREAYEVGLRLFGENRVQEWQEKRGELHNLFGGSKDAARCHLIGPLQSNKVARATEIFDALDAVASLKVASRIDAAARALGRRVPILIEVKLSHEESKHGVAPEDLATLLAGIAPMEGVTAVGLMTVPPWEKSAETARPYFRELRKLRDQSLAVCPTLTELSMGMSNDFAVAIEEGSTCVRIGSALFGRRKAPTAASTVA